MKCNDVRLRLVPFLKGALAADEAAGVESHLTDCVSCAREKEYLKPAVALLARARLATTEIDEGRVVEMVRAQTGVRRLAGPRARAWRWAAAGVAAAAILAAAVWIYGLRLPGGKPVAPAVTGELRASRLRPGDVGMIAQVCGKPEIRQRAADWRTARQYDTFRVGDGLRTGKGQAFALWFTDGTRMRIGPNTQVMLLPPGKGGGRPTVVQLDRGDVSVAVAKARSGFTVQTPAATATATGTRFGLDVAELGRTTLAVFSGSVTFASAAGEVTASGAVRTAANPGAAPEQPVSIGLSDLLRGATGTLRDDFSTPPLNEAVWIVQAVDTGVLIAQEPGRLTLRGARAGNSPYWRARLLTYFFPRQDFSAAVSFRVGPRSQEGAGLAMGSDHSAAGEGVSFVPGQGYFFFGRGARRPFGDETRVFHRLRLEYAAGTGLLTGFVDSARVGSWSTTEPYFFLGFGTASAQNGAPVDLEFADFEAQFAGNTASAISARPGGPDLAARLPGIVFDTGPPDAWDGGSAYNPTVVKRGSRYEMWYAGEPQGRNWRQAGIGLAYSPDGIVWNRYAGNPVLTDESGIGAPCVLYADWRDGKGYYYKMWHRRSAPAMSGRPIKTIAYAESADGIHWNERGIIAGKSFDEGFGDLTSPSVLYLPDVSGLPAPYLMYYSTGGDSNGLRIAVSDDGLHWRPHGAALEPSADGWDSGGVADSRVIFAGGRFHMFYAGYGLDPRLGAAIGYAVSDDGIHWYRSDRPAVAGSNEPGTFDFGVEQPTWLVDGDTVRIWYVCGPYSGLFGFWGQTIGYAEMPVASLSRGPLPD
jgi:predicted GH43/DUF377 family glycosyl hydrolase